MLKDKTAVPMALPKVNLRGKTPQHTLYLIII